MFFSVVGLAIWRGLPWAARVVLTEVLVLTVVTLYAMGILTTRLIGHKMIFNADQDRAGGNGGPGEQWGLVRFLLFG